MNVFIWIAGYLITSLVTYWIIFRGGAEWLENSPVCAFLFEFYSPSWSDYGIKIFCGCVWVVHTIGFIIGCFNPSWRFFLPF